MRLLLPFLLAAVALPAADPDYIIREQQLPAAAFVVSPGSVRTVTITVVTPGGQPVPDLTIAFDAPPQGGIFPDSQEPGQTTLRIPTNASGQAVASFQTGDDPGVFLVTGRLEGAVTGATFSFSNLEDPPAFAAQPTPVKRAVESWVRDQGETIGLTSRVHGPVLVPAGSVVSSALSEHPAAQVDPLVVQQDSWLLWVDDVLFADYPHAARRVLIPASVAEPNLIAQAQIDNVTWWPEVRLPDRSLHPLSVPIDLGIIAEEDGAVAALSPARVGEDANACAIIVHGPNMGQGEQDVQNYRKHLIDTGLVPRNRTIRSTVRDSQGRLRFNSVSESELRDLVDFAVGLNCSKVYLGLFFHGADEQLGGGIGVRKAGTRGEVAAPPTPQRPTQVDVLSWEKLTTILRRLGNVRICGLVGACFSGLGLDWFQGIGFTGSLVTSSNSTEVSYHNENGHLFVNAFIAAKTNTAADSNGDGQVSDAEARQYVVTNDTSPFTFPSTNITIDRIRTSMPQDAVVSAAGTRRIATPFVMIPTPGSAQIINITRRDTMRVDTALTVNIEIADGGVATTLTTLTIPAQTRSFPLVVMGLAGGTTTYKITAVDGAQRYEGTGTIQVGHFKSSTLNVVVPEGGETTVTLDLFGSELMPVDRRVDASSAFDIISADATIATPDPSTVPVPNRAAQVSFKVKGVKAGMTTFDVRLRHPRIRTTINVTVTRPDNRQSFNFMGPFQRDTSFFVAQTFNSFNHPINIARNIWGAVDYDFNSGWNMEFDDSLLPGVRGSLNHETGDFLGTGNSGSRRIAGFPNVPASVSGRVVTDMVSEQAALNSSGKPGRVAQTADGDSGARIEFRYTLGDGVFPGGPIEWDIVGTLAGTCGYFFDPAPTVVSSSGGAGVATLDTQPACTWTATSDSPWLTLTATEGSGPAGISFNVAANDSAQPRTATITANGAPFTVQQDGASNPRPIVSGVVNGASFGGAVASASWITVTGRNLAPVTRLWGDADFNGAALPTSLDGVSATVNGRPAFVFFISPGQLNVLSPDDVFLGAVKIVVTTADGSSDPYLATKLETDPALFLFNPEARRYAAAVHADGVFIAKDGLFPTLTTRPASSGDSILLFGTGFGSTTPPSPTAQLVSAPAPLTQPTVVRIGGFEAEIQFAGLVGSGLYQFNLVVPDLPPGDHEIEIFIDGVPIQAGVFLTLAASP